MNSAKDFSTKDCFGYPVIFSPERIIGKRNGEISLESRDFPDPED
jgi:hypothetical protein